MQLGERVHLVGSGVLGLSLTDAFDCNVYLLDGGAEVALVDAGAGYRPELLVAAIAAAGVEPERIDRILLTHKHADHAGGAAGLVRLSAAEVVATETTAAAVADGEAFNRGLERARRVGSYPADYAFQPIVPDRIVRGGDTVRVGALAVEVIDTPGHCAGHCSFVLRDGDRSTTVFTGDALLPFGQVVLQAIPDCSLADTLSSIEAIGALDADALLAGHGPPVLREGRRHAEFALARIRSGRIPDQLAVPAR